MPELIDKIRQLSIQGAASFDVFGTWLNRSAISNFSIDPFLVYQFGGGEDEVNASVEELLGLEAGSINSENLGEYLGALNTQYPGQLTGLIADLTGASRLQVGVALYDWALGQASQHLGLDEAPTYGSPNYQAVVDEAVAILNGQITPAGQEWLNNNQPQGPSQKEITTGGDAVYGKDGRLISITYEGVRYVPDPQTGQLLPDYRDEPENIQYGGETTFGVDITNLPAGGTDDTTTGTTMEEYSLIRIGDTVYRAYPVPGSNAPRLEQAQPGDVDIGGGTYDNPNTVYENWDDFIYGGVLDTDVPSGDGSQGQSSDQDDGGLLGQAINFIQALLGGGGGSMSQDQAQVLQNVLKDLIDIGDITAETGDQQTDVDVQTDVDASSDVDIGPQTQTTTTDVDIGPQTTDVDIGPQTTDVDIGPQSQTTDVDLTPTLTTDVDIGATDIDLTPTLTSTIEEGALSATGGTADADATIEKGAISISDLFNEGAVQAAGGSATGGTATVGNVSTGPSTATVGNIDAGDAAATIEEGAVSISDLISSPIFAEGAFDINDLISEGAITISDLFDQGAVQAAGGAGGAGGTGGSVGNIDVGDSTATIEQGAIQNMPVFTDAVSVSDIISQGAFSDLISQGAFSDLISEGALSAAGGAGGAGGASTSTAQGGTATSTIAPGAVSNVVDTSGIGQAVTSLGDTLGGFGGDVLDFLGNFLGGQQSTEGQVSENTLAGILAQEAANRYIADKAAESQQNILDFQKKQYDDAIARLQPFYDMGVTQAQEVLPEYIDAAKRDIEYVDIDPFDADDPALRFLQDEARRAIENSAAARGRLNTGGTLTDLQDRSANIALARAGELVGIRDRMNQEERLRDEYDFNKLGRLVGGAQNAANTMTGSDQYYSSLMTPYAERMYEIDAGESARRSQNYYNIFKDLFGI